MRQRAIVTAVMLGIPAVVATAAGAAGCDVALGINKDYHPLGAGGTAGGTVEPSPMGTLGEPCSPKGALGCAAMQPKSQLICGADATWVSNGTCNGSTNCDSTAGPEQGTCKPILPGCDGQTPETVVCSGIKRVTCGLDLVGGADVETCPFVCVSGMCAGECIPTTSACEGNAAKNCGSDGFWQQVTPCTAATEVCIDGKCVTPPSCASGLNQCGSTGSENCCVITSVTGGTYNRSNDATYPATVSDFRLDRFEITVGRFRAYVNALPGSAPKQDDGAHPLIDGSGWISAWDAQLETDVAALKATLKSCGSTSTWTDLPMGNENLPMNCLNWYDVFAFCAWDGGRLPTEAEWNYAASGGNEQRNYPWGASAPDDTYAVFDCQANGNPGDCGLADILTAGSKSPKGDAKWGQADMAGSMWEWVLDWYADPYTNPCNDCADVDNASYRVIRGGSWSFNASFLLSSVRDYYASSVRSSFIGSRCARTP